MSSFDTSGDPTVKKLEQSGAESAQCVFVSKNPSLRHKCNEIFTQDLVYILIADILCTNGLKTLLKLRVL
jgi:hypothetical protein